MRDHFEESTGRPDTLVGRVFRDEPLARRTTLGVGGPADYLVEVETETELQATMRYVSEHALGWYVLGDGSNVLVSDKGIRGVVICLVGEFLKIEVRETPPNPPLQGEGYDTILPPPLGEGDDAILPPTQGEGNDVILPPALGEGWGGVLIIGSGARISRAADVAASHSLSGLEGVGTVPGTVGGAIVMNAGTHRGYIGDVVREVRVVTEDGDLVTLDQAGCEFSYRSSRFQRDRSLTISSCVLELVPADGDEIREHLREVRAHRVQSQPQGASAGCFFKNPEGGSAGGLIEASGCKGMRVGGAVVSDIHANFIMNSGGATASDLRELAETVRELVRRQHSVELEYEVRLVGEW